MNITLELVRDTWRACYDADHLASIYDRPMTPLEVLTRQDGAWADVPAKDRIWTVLHKGVLPDRELRLFAVRCARRALATISNPDHRSVAACDVAERFASGQATHEELKAAARAAYAAADAAADAAAYAAAHAAADAAAYAAADAAADAAAYAAAYAAARAAADAAAYAAARAAARAAAYAAADAAADAAACYNQLADLIDVCKRLEGGAQ